MSLRKIAFLIICLTLVFSACNNDDDSINIPEVVIRDRGEQQIADNDSIVKYLTTHYYNAGDFIGNTNPKITDLIISEIPEDGILPNDTDRVLYSNDGNDTNDAVQTKTINFADTEYTFYILELNKGGGTTSPKFSDKVRVIYEGMLLNNSVFDSAVTPVDLNLIGDRITTFGTIPGWRKVFPLFNVAETFVDNGDGTVSYSNHGTGVMFLPSGLSYFANSPSSDIPAYAPLIFKFELLQSFENDHDNDGVPSWKEDIDQDGEFTIDPDDPEKDGDDDTDNDGTPDYVDADDDGDGVFTINEDLDGDGDPTNDIGPNGIPRYLDPEATESKNT